MASWVLHAINDNHFTYKPNLCIWSNNCCGNRIILFLYIFLVATCVFKRIDHTFLMKCWKVSRCQELEDVESVITSARLTKPFKVLKMRGHYLTLMMLHHAPSILI
ncbi:hypothetical protein PR048_013130, partial [Dryococelus australis]